MPDRPPASRRSSSPGRLALTAMGLVRNPGLSLVALLFFGIGMLFVAMPWGMLARDRAVIDSGTRARAVVTDLDTRHDAEDGTDYVVAYAFARPGGAIVHDGHSSLREEAWGSLSTGDSLTVAYDPADPSLSFPVGNGLAGEGGFTSAGLAVALSMVGLLFSAIPGLILWGVLIGVPGRWHRLLREGERSEAVVVGIETYEDDARLRRIRYRFADRHGTEHEGETDWLSVRRLDAWTEGSAGLVRHARRDPTDHIFVGHDDLAFYG